MCSGSEAGSYVRLIDFVCHSTLDLKVIEQKKNPSESHTQLCFSEVHPLHRPLVMLNQTGT